MNTVELPQCSLEQASRYVRDVYGIDGNLTVLNGERDRNFLVTVPAPAGSHPVRYVFKVANAQEDPELLRCQEQVYDLLQNVEGVQSVQCVRSCRGNTLEAMSGTDGTNYLCRLTTFLEGELLSAVQPRSNVLLASLGRVVAVTGNALAGVNQAALQRPLLWDMQKSESVIEQFLPLLTDPARREIIKHFVARYAREVHPVREQLSTGVIHNDANDNNVIVTDRGPWDQQVVGLIDFGDMLVGWRLTDLAVACAYGMLDHEQPLDVAAGIVRGFHQKYALSEVELQALFAMIAMRLCMSVCICAHQKQLQPDNPYLQISEQPAWALLEALAEVPGRYPEYLFRSVCGFPPVPHAGRINRWVKNAIEDQAVASPVDLDLSTASLLLLDTSVSSPHLSPADLIDDQGSYDPEKLARAVTRALEDAGAEAAIGRYDEYRLIYGSEQFVDFSGHWRTLHLGIDIFQPAGSPVNAVLDGEVVGVANNAQALDYGGTVILQHTADDSEQPGNPIRYYTLYGHLDPASLAGLAKGKAVTAGQQIAEMGDSSVNGNWPPHLHFEIITDLLGYTDTFVGVGSHPHRDVWLSLCPDPGSLLGLPESFIRQPLSDHNRQADTLVADRRRYYSEALSTAYREPILMARGAGQYLYDFSGRAYLDAVNNVPHVGHCHPAVVRAGACAAGVLSTNTRYLYPGLTRYASRLLEKFPDSLQVVFLVNSGSEANDLALRLARNHTGHRDAVVLDHAYHGNLGTLVDLSPYKHNGKGGQGPPDWVHTVPLPDRLRDGRNITEQEFVTGQLEKASAVIGKATPVAAIFAEPVSGCGGQVTLPAGYLAGLYALARQAGGLCIADEVQTGFGRAGSHFWAFETQDVVPDIVTIGKPAGNGHPLGAVITTREVAASFVTGMEYFNTFGGNPVSCAIGEAVLDVIDNLQLQAHAAREGTYFKERLNRLAKYFPIMADVRGLGLFLGVELVDDPEQMSPAADQASYIAERMKQSGILISTDGPMHNVLKIKPPMVFNRNNIDFLVDTLGKVLEERWSQPGGTQRHR